MLAVLKSLEGLVLVTDTCDAPATRFLGLLCMEDPSCTVLSLDVPRHRLMYVGDSCTVVDLYGQDLAELPRLERGKKTVVVDGVGRLMSRLGVGAVLHSVLMWEAHCVVMVLHSELLPEHSIKDIADLAQSVIAFGPALNAVATLSKRKGGKVLRATERVVDWTGPVVVSEKKTLALSCGHTHGQQALEDAGDRRQEVLPFVKTAVEGKMIFDIEDMREGDYEDAADDPDADLDV